MNNETMYDWASAMLEIIHQVDSEVEGGLSGMGSSDGYYVTSDVAKAIEKVFQTAEGYEVQWLDPATLMYPVTEFCVVHEANPDRGFCVSWDPTLDSPEVGMNFFNE